MTMVGVLLSLGRRLSDEPFIAMKTSFRDRGPRFRNRKTLRETTLVEAPGIEPGSEAAFHATSTSVVPVFISPTPRPGTRLGYGQPR